MRVAAGTGVAAVVTINSAVAGTGVAAGTVYAASKSGVCGWTAAGSSVVRLGVPLGKLMNP